jgi:hypothetical protein
MTDPAVISPVTVALVGGANAQGLAGTPNQALYLP